MAKGKLPIAVSTMDLRESLAESVVDRDRCIIQNVLIAKSESRNTAGALSRVYTDAALDSIAALSEGASVYLNHMSESEYREYNGVRDVRLLAAKIQNARRSGKSIIGDLVVLNNPNRDHVLSLAESKPLRAGLSLYSPPGGFVMKRGQFHHPDVVEQISVLRSVDIVSEAGMANSLFESAKHEKGGENMEENEILNNEIKALKESVESLTKQLTESNAKVDALAAENAKLVESAAKAEQRKTSEAEVNALIVESKLQVNDVIRENLIAMPDKAAREAFVKALRESVRVDGVALVPGDGDKALREQIDRDFARLG